MASERARMASESLKMQVALTHAQEVIEAVRRQHSETPSGDSLAPSYCRLCGTFYPCTTIETLDMPVVRGD